MNIYTKTADFRKNLAASGRLLAFDHGEKRIGVAISDSTRNVATPHSIIRAFPQKQMITTIDAILTELEPVGIVIGLPLHMNGDDSEGSAKARLFAEVIAPRALCPTLLFDERLTTAAIERMLVQEADLSREKRVKHRDKLAACILLQSLCDALFSPLSRLDE